MDHNFLWWKDGIIYQVYPRSFADTNQDGIGDLPGITTHLDYLAELGVSAIWLSPVYLSPDIDFGYDVSNYTAINPTMGTLEDFDLLVSEAHRRDIRIVMDLVLNHTSQDHPWFQDSRRSRHNPHQDWYLWADPQPGKKVPNNWGSVFGGTGWEYESQRDQFYFHMFAREQPDLNWRCPEVRQAMLDVFRFWLDRGVDGFRLDVFNCYFKQQDLKDNPTHPFGLRGFERQRHIYDVDQPEMMPLLVEIRQLLDRYPERYMVGEPFLSSPQRAAHYCGSQLLHAAFNFEFTHSRWAPKQFLKAIQQWEAALGESAWPNYVLGNHDLIRLASRYQSGEADNRLFVASALLLTLRGTPYIYYGEEIGMRELRLKRHQLLDPVGKKYFPFYKGRDGCRGPMQWNASSQAGFSLAAPWLPVHPDYPVRNVDRQSADPQSLLNFYRKLIAIRRQSIALRQGKFIPLNLKSRHALAYLRQSAEQTILVALNFSNQPEPVVLPEDLASFDWQILLSTSRTAPEIPPNLTLVLGPDEVLILQKMG